MSIDPLTCKFASPAERIDGHVLCVEHNCFVECQTPHWGEPPMCAYEEPDNSDEAKAWRVAWMREHKE